MKIAILTLPINTNYGGTLQAYALSTVLKRLGHDVDVLANRDFYEPRPVNVRTYCARILRKLRGEQEVHIFNERKRSSRLRRKGANIQAFAHDKLNLRKIYSFVEINPAEYDAIIVGSDQIWRKSLFCRMWDTDMPDAFLRFASGWDGTKVAYAASFGADHIRDYSAAEIEQCRMLLKQFDALSVREESGRDVCRQNFNIEVEHMPDPTMLLTPSDYDALIEQSGVPDNPGDMFCYILKRNDVKEKIVSKLSAETGMKPFFVGYWKQKEGIASKGQVEKYQPVEAWLKAVRDSKLVVTDSFHATVFSILYGKPFIVICEEGPAQARFKSLLSTFGIENRIVTSPTVSALEALQVSNQGEKIEAERQRGLDFLKNAIAF